MDCGRQAGAAGGEALGRPGRAARTSLLQGNPNGPHQPPSPRTEDVCQADAHPRQAVLNLPHYVLGNQVAAALQGRTRQGRGAAGEVMRRRRPHTAGSRPGTSSLATVPLPPAWNAGSVNSCCTHTMVLLLSAAACAAAACGSVAGAGQRSGTSSEAAATTAATAATRVAATQAVALDAERLPTAVL